MELFLRFYLTSSLSLNIAAPFLIAIHIRLCCSYKAFLEERTTPGANGTLCSVDPNKSPSKGCSTGLTCVSFPPVVSVRYKTPPSAALAR